MESKKITFIEYVDRMRFVYYSKKERKTFVLKIKERSSAQAIHYINYNEYMILVDEYVEGE